MKQAQYEEALSGLKSVPERHIVIDGRTYYSVAQLEEAREKAGLVKVPDGPGRVVRKPKAPGSSASAESAGVQTSAPTPPPAPARTSAAPSRAPKSPAQPATPAEPGSSKDEGNPEPSNPASPEGIPEDWRTYKYNDLRALAKAQGADPVPNTQTDLVAFIESKLAGS